MENKVKFTYLILGIIFLISCKDKSTPVEFEEISRESYIAKVVELSTDFTNQVEINTLDEVNEKLVGNWFGIVNTPWIDPYHIVFKYNISGNYSCYNITHAEDPYSGFYYGTDEDSSIKTIEFENILTNGSVEGDIVILYSTKTTNTFAIKDLRFYDSGKKVKFNLNSGNSVGDISVSLFKL